MHVSALILLVGAAAAIAAGAAAAQERTGALSLADAIRIAHERNPDFLGLQTTLAAAELDLEAARSVFRTRLASRFDTSERTGAELGSVYEVGVSKLAESGSRWGVALASSQFGERAISELRFSYRLPFFGNPAAESRFAVDSAEIALERRRRLLAIGSEELAAQVIAAYYGVVLAANAAVLARTASDTAESLARAAAVRAAAGTTPELDARRARLHAAAAQRETRLAEMALERSNLRLATVLGLAHDAPLVLDDDIPEHDVAPDAAPLPAPDELEALAVAKRPELAALEAEIALLDRKIAAHAPRLMPPVDVSLQVSLVGEGRALGETFDHYEPRFGIGFGMALDQGREPDIGRRRLALQHAAAVRAHAALTDRVRGEARDAVLAFEEAASELALSRELAELAEEDYRSVELRYQTGRATTEQALESAQQRAAARHRVLEARVAYWIAHHRVAALAGATPFGGEARWLGVEH